ncbi:MAG: hypothetical protein ACP5HT_00945 [Conexivisphaera sp.]
MRRSHTSIWRWVHRYRYSPVLGSFDVNRGAHVAHVGGRFDSHLLVPIIP